MSSKLFTKIFYWIFIFSGSCAEVSSQIVENLLSQTYPIQNEITVSQPSLSANPSHLLNNHDKLDISNLNIDVKIVFHLNSEANMYSDQSLLKGLEVVLVCHQNDFVYAVYSLNQGHNAQYRNQSIAQPAYTEDSHNFNIFNNKAMKSIFLIKDLQSTKDILTIEAKFMINMINQLDTEAVELNKSLSDSDKDSLRLLKDKLEKQKRFLTCLIAKVENATKIDNSYYVMMEVFINTPRLFEILLKNEYFLILTLLKKAASVDYSKLKAEETVS